MAPFGNAKFLVRETLAAGSKNGLGASEHRGHTTTLAQRGKVRRREKVTRHTLLLHAERVTSSQDHPAIWIAIVVTREHAKKFGLVTRLS